MAISRIQSRGSRLAKRVAKQQHGQKKMRGPPASGALKNKGQDLKPGCCVSVFGTAIKILASRRSCSEGKIRIFISLCACIFCFTYLCTYIPASIRTYIYVYITIVLHNGYLFFFIFHQHRWSANAPCCSQQWRDIDICSSCLGNRSNRMVRCGIYTYAYIYI